MAGAESQERVMLVLERSLVSREDVEEALLLTGLCFTQGGWGRRFKGNWLAADGVGVTGGLRE